MSSTRSASFGQSYREDPDTLAAKESDLFRRAQNGDRGAFGQLAIKLQDRLYNALLRMVGNHDEARELTQETFLKALTSIETFRGESQPYTWMFRIGVNLAISHLRKIKRQRTFSLDAPLNGRPIDDQASRLVDRLARQQSQPSDQAIQREVSEQVLKALGRLDGEYRALLIMRDIEGFDYQQMADVLGIPLGTLKSRLFRARIAMRDQLIIVTKGQQ